MSQQYRRVNMTEVARVLDAMSPGEEREKPLLEGDEGMTCYDELPIHARFNLSCAKAKD